MTKKSAAKSVTRATARTRRRPSAKYISAANNAIERHFDLLRVEKVHAADPAEHGREGDPASNAAELPEAPSSVSYRPRPSGQCAIVASAFYSGTTGAVRRQLNGKRPLALIILVPGPSWIGPIRRLFLERFKDRWRPVRDQVLKTPQQKAEISSEVAADLAAGYAVVGVAAHRDALPPTLVTATDLTIRIKPPNGRVIAHAIRMFTGQRVTSSIGDDIVAGLELPDMVAAFRADSSPEEIIERLRKSTSALSGAGTSGRLPKLEKATEYGPAQVWGMDLARDIADYRAGRLAWEHVDRGAVLYSEPGLGKSLYARVLAKACGVPLVSFSIADLFASSPGYLDSVVKASRAMFDRAAALAPCILFLDEIDALPNRATMSPRGAEWWTPVVTDFLLSLDSAVAGQRTGIVVIGATNNIAGVDAALLRPGRLERAIEIKRPSAEGVRNILRHHLADDLLESDLTEIAGLLERSTGAEIMLAVRQARRLARQANRELFLEDLRAAVLPTEKLEPETLWRVCVHEAGHVIASLALPFGKVLRCTIASKDGAKGETVMDRQLTAVPTRAPIEERVVVLLAGRAAEYVLTGAASTGAGGDPRSDLGIATQIVALMHAGTGLGKSLVYTASYDETLDAVRGDYRLRKEVGRHLAALERRAIAVIQQHRGAAVAIAEALRHRRHMSGDEMRELFDATPPEPASSRWKMPSLFGRK
ncbi:AAA family ATPase [Bradyrhizobium uaiense]|uniref:AAA family ATPase n=1 Tax=Bradyrhizobium uaiense TaxID=2594946 RepID=A0A6P1BHN1_9BRAD|nr:AAA family ATPase [Bradyrhizobium uaiense]NEU97987.1 AAA family ATPase [Bradyrhizobium uaiense]